MYQTQSVGVVRFLNVSARFKISKYFANKKQGVLPTSCFGLKTVR
jgi:hypothetical protein